MGTKTAGVGHFQIPTAPAAGVSVTSGAANVFTTTYVQLIASTVAALYITGIYVEEAAASAGTYISVQLATGGAGAETIVGQHLIAPQTGSTVTRCYKPINPPIPVATATRIACKTADSVGAVARLVTLEVIAQSNVVDDGIPITTVTAVTNQLSAAAIATAVWQDAVSGDFTVASSIGKALYIANIAPGAAGGHFISGSNAGTTTLGALTITGVTTHTGNVVLSDGLTISAPSTGNRAGFDISGNGTGAALKLTAGATGIGFSVAGGATSGDGIKVTTTSGHGVNLAPVGSSMHGFLSTGGNAGTSDGMKLVAGTGGVDFRASQTGNLTGNVSGSVGSVTGAVGSVAGNVGGNVVGTVASVTGNVAGSVGSVVGAVGSVTGNVGGNVSGSIGSLGAQAKLDVNAEADTALLDVGLTAVVTGRIDVAVSSRLATAGYTAPLSAGATANAVWDELQASHLTAGTVGLNQALGAVAGLDAAGVRAAVGLATANLDTQLAALQSDTDNIQTRLPAALVGGRMDSSVGAMAANVVTAAALAADAGTELATAFLVIDMSTIAGEAARSPLNALRFLRNRWDLAAGTLTVTKEDDTTTAWTAAIATDPAAQPVIGSNPA